MKLYEKVIIDELKHIKKQYPTPRLTEIKDEVQEIIINEEAMILPESIFMYQLQVMGILNVFLKGLIKQVRIQPLVKKMMIN